MEESIHATHLQTKSSKFLSYFFKWDKIQENNN